MSSFTLYSVGKYGPSFPGNDRDRTIAAIYVTQNTSQLTFAQMRRDVLTHLASVSAVGYWLRQGWLEKSGKIGRIELLCLTTQGINQCGSLTGPSANITKWINLMRNGGHPQGAPKVFKELN